MWFSWLALAGLAQAADLSDIQPTVRVDWKKDLGTLWVDAPPGTYVQKEGPLDGWWEVGPRRVELASTGVDLYDGLRIDLPAGQRGLRGELTVPICEEGGTACRLVDLRFLGKLEGKKGKGLVLGSWQPEVVPEPEAAEHHGFEEALEIAAREGKHVLVDFGAVWCPPCNLLEAQVLDDPEDAALLSGFVLAKVDVDRVESWPVKDRFDVGGYPTVIVLDPEGKELDRTVGYTSEAGFKAWLEGVDRVVPLSELPEPAELDGAEAAKVAQRLGRLGKQLEAGEYLKRAAETGAFQDPAVAAAYHEARLHVLPQAADVVWMAENGAPDLMHWVFRGMEAARSDAAARDALLGIIETRMDEVDDIALSDLLYVVGALSQGHASRTSYAAAARVLEAALTGDPAQDRGHWVDLAGKWRLAGEVDRAEAVLNEAIAAYPDEFTFHYALAGTRLKAGRPAVEAAKAALDHAYGDNMLRATNRLAQALHAEGRTEEALALIDRTLERAIRPRDSMRVRTPRYLQELAATRDDIHGDAGQ